MIAVISSISWLMLPVASGQVVASEQWPQGELNCWHGYRRFDPLLQKRQYTVGVHAPVGLETAWREFNLTFEEYLDRTVGDRFIPPIRFRMKPTVDPLRDWVRQTALSKLDLAIVFVFNLVLL
jgi:hypothetical protein